MVLQPLSGVVLAGGKSTRLGEDKRRLRLWGADGPTLLEHTLALLGTVCDDVTVVLNDADAWPELQVQRVADAWPEGGSLGGIATGLAHARQPFALVVAADMPLLNRQLLEWLAAQPRTYDILAPRNATAAKSGGWETLCAIYRRTCLPIMEDQLRGGQLKIKLVYDRVNVQPVPLEQLAPFDPHGLVFHNINTPDDLLLVRQLQSANREPDAVYNRPPSQVVKDLSS